MQSPSEAAAPPPTTTVDEATSSMSSEEVEEDAPVDISGGAALLSNGGDNSAGSDGVVFPRVNTMPSEIINSVKLEMPAGLERSKIERQRRNSIFAEEAAQIFDDRISVQQKALINARYDPSVTPWIHQNEDRSADAFITEGGLWVSRAIFFLNDLKMDSATMTFCSNPSIRSSPGLFMGSTAGIRSSQCSFFMAGRVNFPQQRIQASRVGRKSGKRGGALGVTCRDDKILVANRGETFVRVIRTTHEMGIPCVAIYSTIDKDGLRVKLADESFCIGEAPSSQSMWLLRFVLILLPK